MVAQRYGAYPACMRFQVPSPALEGGGLKPNLFLPLLNSFYVLGKESEAWIGYRICPSQVIWLRVALQGAMDMYHMWIPRHLSEDTWKGRGRK